MFSAFRKLIFFSEIFPKKYFNHQVINQKGKQSPAIQEDDRSDNELKHNNVSNSKTNVEEEVSTENFLDYSMISTASWRDKFVQDAETQFD